MYFIEVESNIINIGHIVCIRKHRDGKYYIELDNDVEIQVKDYGQVVRQLPFSNGVCR